MKIYRNLAVAGAVMVAVSAFAKGDITGSVFSKTTAEPLDYVNIALLNPETGLPVDINTETNAQGEFLLKDVPDGDYLLRVSTFGSVPQEREVTVAQGNSNLGKIELAEDAKMLQEVVVTGTKSQVSINTQRRVFNVSSNINSSGASAEELLASVPSVDVSSDGEVYLRGNSDVLVWIDGKLMGMNADNRAQILSQIPAASIQSIEVMTNPSSKHSTEGTAGIINIILKKDHRQGYFGSADANVDHRGSVNANFNITFNSGKFETFAGLGLKSTHTPAGSTSLRSYDDGTYLDSRGSTRKHENGMFLRLGTNYSPDDNNTLYLSGIGTLGHTWGYTDMNHLSTIPSLWSSNFNYMKDHGNTRGANILLGYKHLFGPGHSLDMNVSYNIWVSRNTIRSHETEDWSPARSTELWLRQRQDVKISNWEAEVEYSNQVLPWLEIEAGFKGNYNHENSPASYASGLTEETILPLNNLYNRFVYNTDISALYFGFSGKRGPVNFAAALRGEAWQIRTRSLGYGQTNADVSPFKKNEFALFPSASIGVDLGSKGELNLNYSRRIRRPFGPQLNTFENIADPSEVHLGNPEIMPEYSNVVELSYAKNWSAHTLTVTGYMRSNTDMISHISFLAPMAADENVNTMYYGHANVGNILNTGVEVISRNTLFNVLTLTTTLNAYNSHLKAWSTDYPLHGEFYPISGKKQDKLVWSVRCMASVKLPWDLTFQATGRYNSRRVMAQGVAESNWDVEAALKRSFGNWSVSLICKDIFDSKKSREILYGNGYTQSISKWTGGRTFRLGVSYNFGKSKPGKTCNHQHIDTGGYGEEHVH